VPGPSPPPRSFRPDWWDLADAREDWDRADRAEWTDPPPREPRDRRDESLTDPPDDGTSMLGSYELADDRYDRRDDDDRAPALRKESDEPYAISSSSLSLRAPPRREVSELVFGSFRCAIGECPPLVSARLLGPGSRTGCGVRFPTSRKKK